MPKKSEAKKTVKPSKTNKTGKEEKVKKLSQLEFEKKVIELANKGLTSEKIGENLRKQGIHPKNFTKKISGILKDKNLYINPDLKNIKTKLERVKAHSEKNKQDKRAMREKDRIFAQLRKLTLYSEKRNK